MEINRLFLVGCPRSGTTLLQSMVASHSQVVSFPETHFFSETLPINPLLRRLKLHGSNSRTFVKNFLDTHNYSFAPFADNSWLTHRSWCQKLVDIIDQMTVHDKPQDISTDYLWGLEKTPRHLHYISSIEQTDSNNNFLHILRDGPSVIASLHLATKEYPGQWGGERSVKKCISWWNNSIKASMKYRGQSNHLFVVYQQLLEEPEIVLQAISSFLNLKYEQSMISEYHQTAGSLTTAEEQWKSKNQEQSLQKSDKLHTHFDDSTINYIKENILDLDLAEFYH